MVLILQKTFDALVQLASDNNLTPDVYADVKPRVFLARDTRPSSEYLAKLFVKGAEALGAQVTCVWLECVFSDRKAAQAWFNKVRCVPHRELE